jgi:hypothetical protein
MMTSRTRRSQLCSSISWQAARDVSGMN